MREYPLETKGTIQKGKSSCAREPPPVAPALPRQRQRQETATHLKPHSPILGVPGHIGRPCGSRGGVGGQRERERETETNEYS